MTDYDEDDLIDNRVRLSALDNIDDYVEHGDRVRVQYRDGSLGTAAFRKVQDEITGEYTFHPDWADDEVLLYDYWTKGVAEQRDFNVEPTERVVRVFQNGTGYSFPASMVGTPDIRTVEGVGEGRLDTLRQHGYGTVVDLVHAEVDDLERVGGIGRQTATAIKSDVGYPSGIDGSVGDCPIDGCRVSFPEEELYDHCIGEHGWWSPELEEEYDP